jgi:prepilin-type N-terminal cleavage/methylation domain-containing protein
MRNDLHRGFTLLEVLLVVSLLAVVAAVVWPNFGSPELAEHLGESARRMKALIAMCRAEAMNQTLRYRIRIRPDGSVRLVRQADAIKAPHLYIPVPADWARTTVLLPDVWVESVQILPDGPPPVRIIDEKLEFPDMDITLTPIEELPRALELDLEPDGTCNSTRWVLRDERGAGLLFTLDGRLGRVTLDEWPNALPADLHRPPPLPEDEEAKYNPEDYR